VTTSPSARLFALPSLPRAAAKALDLLQQPRADSRKLARVAEDEPEWASELLRLALSPVWELGPAPGDVADVFGRLGFRRCTQLVAASAVAPLLRAPLPGYGLAEGELWSHSLAVALATREILLERGLKPCEEAFTAALLHDVGKLVISAALETEPVPADAVELLVEDAEIRAVGMSHTEAGAILLEHWGLPYWLVAAVGSHHAPHENSFLVADLIHLADTLCLSAGLGTGGDGLRYRVSPEVSLRWNLSRRSVERVVERTVEALAEAGLASPAGEGS
jgi:putative nucleotidyltransferase with HDIG domain